MAIASPPAAAPSATSGAPGAARRLGPAVATVVGVAVLLRLFYDNYLNYDARYALVWARDLVRGLKPDYTADFAPTPHPLETVVSILAVPFGDGADAILTWAILLCFGLLVWLTYRLGAQLFGHWAGVVAALVVATRPALQRDALLGYQDTAFACVIAGAVLLEAQRPRRGAPVLALLAVAGLMRPEAWALAGLYWLWLCPPLGWPARLKLLPLVALAPVLWALLDLYVTGDLLHSLHGTADLADAVDRRRDIADSPYWTLQYYGFALREPLVIGIPVGLYFAWRHRMKQAVLPLVVVAVMTVVFMLGPLFGLPLISRYVRTPAVFLALFYGLAVCGWLLLAAGKERTRWKWAGIATAALSLAFLPWHLGMLNTLHDTLASRGRPFTALKAIAHDGAVERAVVRCGGTVSGADHRVMPHLRWWLDLEPFAASTVEGGASPLQRVFVAPADTPAMHRFYGVVYPRAQPPGEYRLVARNRYWRVFADPGCVAL